MSHTTISGGGVRSNFPTIHNENMRTARSVDIAAKTADFTAWSDDASGSPKDFYPVDATSGAVTVTLPAVADVTSAGNEGRPLWVKKTDASVNAVTLDADGSETIDGATTKVLSSQYDVCCVVCDGAEWWVLVG